MISFTSLLVTSTFLLSPDGDLFAALDRNRDGVVTADEVSDSQRVHFRRALRIADINADGQLTASELSAALRGRAPVTVSPAPPAGTAAAAAFARDPARLDRNQDGQISVDEVPPAFRERYRQTLAQFGQPALPVDLFRQYAQGRQPADANRRPETPEMKNAEDSPQRMRRGDRAAGESPAQPVEAAAAQRIRALFERLDRDGNGRLSGREIPPRLKQNLPRIDTDRDGSVSRAELARGMRVQASRMPE